MIVSKPSGSHAHNGRLIRKSAIFHQEIALLTQLRTESRILCHRRLSISMEKEQRDYSRHCKQKEPLPCSVLGYTFFAVLTRAPIRFLLPTLFCSALYLSPTHARTCVHGPLTISTERLFSLPRKTNKTILEHDFKPRGFAKSTSRLFFLAKELCGIMMTSDRTSAEIQGITTVQHKICTVKSSRNCISPLLFCMFSGLHCLS